MAFRRSLRFCNVITAAVVTTNPLLSHELSLVCSDGVKLAAQLWKPSSTGCTTSATKTILCIHGWLDNCRSFYRLGPVLGSDYTVVALDLPGHGRSSHKSIDAPPMVQAELAYYVSEAIDELRTNGLFLLGKDQPITLIGHSLGAGIASLYASSFPEQVDQLILLDGAGFLARHANDTSLHVRNHILRRKRMQRKTQPKESEGKRYPSLEAAILRRLQSIQSMPGNQRLSYETARELVLRGTTYSDNTTTSNSEERLSIRFRHDSRYAWPSIQYMTQEQNEGIFQRLQDVDCCILLAEDGWPFRQEHIDRALELIQPRMVQRLPGSHYFHADVETHQDVTDMILKFLQSTQDKE